MALPMTPIFTQTVGAGGAAQVVFNNIPQFYTDLKVVLSVRAARTTNTWDSIGITFNYEGTGSNYSSRLAFAQAGSTGSNSNTTSSALTFIQYASTAGATANTFGNGELYIPNYTSSNFKQVIGDSVAPTNGSADYILTLSAGLWRSTSAISAIGIFPVSGGNFAQHSTASLYGIIRPGA